MHLCLYTHQAYQHHCQEVLDTILPKSNMYPGVEKQSGSMGPIVWQGREYPLRVLLPEDIVQEICGSYMRSTSFMNCSLWTVVLVKIWTYWMIPSYSRGKSGFHNVSTQAHFNMSLFPPKILDWPMMTSMSASSSSLDCPSSWSHGKETSPLCWQMISLICLQTLPWN